MHRPSPGRLIVCLVGLLALAGCQEDEITHAVVPRAAEPEKTRLIGVIYPHADRTWFFKLTGPEGAFEGVAGPFNDFLNSVHFTGRENPPVEWTLPPGWTQDQENGQKMRFATIHLGAKEKPLELTVTALGQEAAAVLPNVNRWRGQLGLDPVAEANLKALTQDIKINGDPATLVDMTGESAAHKPGAAAKAAWTYTKPEGWTESPHPEAGPVPAEAVFQIEEGDKTAKVTVTALGGPAGGLMPNVMRWCNQVGAAPVAPEQLDKFPKVAVAGRESPYLDLGGDKGRILGAITARGDRTWFFKMMGPAGLVEKQKPQFEEFLKSVKFAGGPGGDQ